MTWHLTLHLKKYGKTILENSHMACSTCSAQESKEIFNQENAAKERSKENTRKETQITAVKEVK